MKLFETVLMVACAAALYGAPADSAEAKRTQWYRDAKFGMFIHWGPYSLASIEASWPIMTEGFNETEYRALPQRFNPENFDATALVRLAKAAGQKYMVITTKHHDGFVMFDSLFTEYKITKTPYQKDIVAELAEAAKAEGMPLGFYYSPPDMHHPGYRDTSKPASANWHGEPWRPEWPLYLDYMELQLTELLTRYNDVALIWFDGLGQQGKYNGRRFHDLIHRLQPATLINDRIGLPGDFGTPEQFAPKGIPTKKPRGTNDGGTMTDWTKKGNLPKPEEFRLWETCMTINETWAYNKNDRKFKSSRDLIRTLVDVASKGGNFLLNVGPTPDGTIQPEFQERLMAIGKWLKVNGDAIYGTTYGPLQELTFGRSTQKGNTVYIHVFDWPKGSLEINDFSGQAAAASLLAGHRPLKFTQNGRNLKIEVPTQAPDPDVSVVALKMK
jgi:alpha-L-fucosidase